MYKDDSDLGPSICRSSGRLAEISRRGVAREMQMSVFQTKRKKKEKGKTTVFAQEISARAIVGFLSSVKMRRRGFSSG